ncbi:MAG TPA: response regulator [Acidimicrobiia bacterium]|nr:response regulator [Acidimicrobiia bacterium]
MNHARLRRILVADDADSITMLLSVALGAEGYKVVTADDGVAAYELGREYRIDLAVLDHLMPGLLGMEVLEKWRSDGLDFPVMMLSGIDDESAVVESLRLGATDYMRKPFRVAELIARVALALDRSPQ